MEEKSFITELGKDFLDMTTKAWKQLINWTSSKLRTSVLTKLLWNEQTNHRWKKYLLITYLIKDLNWEYIKKIPLEFLTLTTQTGIAIGLSVGSITVNENDTGYSSMGETETKI